MRVSILEFRCLRNKEPYVSSRITVRTFRDAYSTGMSGAELVSASASATIATATS
jgi:hypothetical protein